MEEMKKNHPVVPYSSDIVKKHFFSIIDHFKRKGRIVDNSSVINNLALQIKRNYFTIQDYYPFIKSVNYEELSKTDNSPESGNSLLSLLEIIKTFTNINYEFVDVNDKNYIYSIHNSYTNFLLLALGDRELLRYDETAKKKYSVNLLPLNNDFLRKYNNTSEKASVGPLLRIKIEGQFPSYLSVSKGQRYIIQTAVIKITHSFESNVSSHSLTCYICNGVQYIHDPNNVILQINWIKNDSNNEDPKDKIIEYYKNKYNTTIKELNKGTITVEINYSIYLREDVLLKMERENAKKKKPEMKYGNYESGSIRQKVIEKGNSLLNGEIITRKTEIKEKEKPNLLSERKNMNDAIPLDTTSDKKKRITMKNKTEPMSAP
jgi:hypothetical protein